MAFVESPLFDPLRTEQSRPHENIQMVTGGRLADAQFSGYQQAAHAVFDQVPIPLRREILSRISEPEKDLLPASVCHRLQ